MIMKKLPEICEIKTGKKDANHANSSGKYRFYTCASQYSMCDTFSFSGESVIVPGNGDIGLVFYYNGDFEAYQRTYVLSNIKIFPKYLYYHLVYKWRHINSDKQYGSTVRYVRMSNFTSYEVPVPTLDEQKRIVARIEELFSELDNGVENLRKTKRQLMVYRQAVMKSVFHDIMSTSEIRPMGDILAGIEGGKSFKCEERPPQADEYGIVKVSAVTWGIYDEEESKTCQPGQFLESKRISAGDFLFSRANTLELVGNCVVVDTVSKNLMLSDKILRFHFKDDVMPKYVMYYLRTREGKKQIQEFSTGNQESMRNIGQDRIKRILVPVCSIEEQGSVIREIETRLSVCDSIEKTVDTALQQAEAMRQSILKQAFEGSL